MGIQKISQLPQHPWPGKRIWIQKQYRTKIRITLSDPFYGCVVSIRESSISRQGKQLDPCGPAVNSDCISNGINRIITGRIVYHHDPPASEIITHRGKRLETINSQRPCSIVHDGNEKTMRSHR